MTKRIRTRSIRVNPDSYTCDAYNGTRTSYANPSETTTWTIMGSSQCNVPTLFRHRVEEMQDEQPTNRRGINEVSHKKCDPMPWDQVFDPSATLCGRGDTNLQYKGSGPAYYARGYGSKCDSIVSTMKAAVSRPKHQDAFFSASDATYAPHSSLAVLPDMLGSLPAKVVSRLEAWHGSTALIEARELPALFRMFTRRGLLVQLIRSGDLATSGIGRGKRLWEAFTDTTLGYQYGLRPTVQDLRKLAEEASRVQSKSLRFSVSHIQSTENSYTCKDIWTTGSSAFDASTQWGSSRLTRVDGCMVDATRAFSGLEDFTRRYIGLNGAGLVWEVLPFSFIVDAFLHIDDVLDAVFLGTRSDISTQYWTSTKTENIARWSMSPRRSDAYSSWVWNDPSSVKTEFDSLPPWTVGYTCTQYNRVRREPPSPLSAMRLSGVGAKNGFLYSLIALGLLPLSKR